MKTVVQQLMLSLLAAAAFARPAAAEVRSVFAYRLSDSTGDLPLNWAALNGDPIAGELYVIDSSGGSVDVFNDNGMQVFAFGDDSNLGAVMGVAALPGGDLAVLAQKPAGWSLVRCNFRGEPRSEIAVHGMPADFGAFSPGTLRLSGFKLYLADKGAMKVIAVGFDGAVTGAWNIPALLKLDAKKALGADMRGFNVDRAGNLLGTIPGLFLALVITPEGEVRSFGVRGSSAGKFNVVAGIAADESGNIFVADTLKCAVLVFDKDLKFIDQLGYRGEDDEEGLIAPQEIAVAQGRLYVSQSRGGVKAFDFLLNETPGDHK